MDSILPSFQKLYRKRTLSKKPIQFSKEIIKNAPGISAKNWRLVAMSFNLCLHEIKLWNTKYFFFNAAHCREAFRTTLLMPFSLKKDKNAKIKSFIDSNPFIEETLQVYSTEIDENWKLIHTEKVWRDDNLENALLPKEVHRLRLTWVLKRVLSRQEPPFLLNRILIYTSLIFNILFFKVSLIIKRIFNDYSPLYVLSYSNCMFESSNFNLLFRLLLIGGGFLELHMIFKTQELKL